MKRMKWLKTPIMIGCMLKFNPRLILSGPVMVAHKINARHIAVPI